ncbi:hypothetical protein WJX84_010222 [Apatococcus fuscideae]|uniref:BZIP domain-containing protein n=1 Tax=Apatococcus fuscideae TaxID=2026836 RepID=A0AAW1TAW5_9CHLO
MMFAQILSKVPVNSQDLISSQLAICRSSCVLSSGAHPGKHRSAPCHFAAEVFFLRMSTASQGPHLGGLSNAGSCGNSPDGAATTSKLLFDTIGSIELTEEGLFGSTTDLDSLLSPEEPGPQAILTDQPCLHSQDGSPSEAEESHASDILLASNANPQISPGSSGNSEDSDDDDEPTELNCTRRVLANRQSARQSRLRKMHKTSVLEQMVKSLQLSITQLEPALQSLQSRKSQLREQSLAIQSQFAALMSESNCKQSLNKALHDEVSCLRSKLMPFQFASQGQHQLSGSGLDSTGLSTHLSSDSFMSESICSTSQQGFPPALHIRSCHTSSLRGPLQV